jgi:Putative zinc-finger
MWAVDGLDPEEKDLVATHLAGCAACRAEADELEGVVRLLSAVDVASIDLGESSGSERPDETTLRAPGTGGRGIATPEPGSWAERVARRAAVAVGTVAAAVAVAASVVAASAGSVAAPPGRSMVLHGGDGVRATVALTAEPWGSRAVLTEDGESAGAPYTVSMESGSGYRWVAGTYRTTGSGSMQVQLTCPVSPVQITEVWVTGPNGQTVLSGYA